MFKRREKKFKAVFKLQFQATQVPQLKAKGLMISLVPVGEGKPTVRLGKARIIEGTCTWENPIYETIKLVQETKTGRIKEKFYYVVVSTGTSKSAFLGEVSLDFADLAGATKPLNLTLPLQTSKSGAILQVTVQRMQLPGVPDSRYYEGDETYDQDSDTQVRESDSNGKKDTKTLEEEHSGSLEEAKPDRYSNEPRDGVKETSDVLCQRLKDQIRLLEREAEVSEIEFQSLRKQIVKETQRGQQLSEQIVSLKDERDALKAECEEFKSSSAVSCDIEKETESFRSSVETLKHELQHEKGLNKKLRLQLQKKEDSNSELVIAMRDLNKKLDQKNIEISQLSSEVKNRSEGSIAQEDMANSHGNADEGAEMLRQKIESLYSEIDLQKKENVAMQMEVERLTQDCESLEAENKEMQSMLEQNEKEKIQIQRNYAESTATVRKLKLEVASLEAENKRQAFQYSESLDRIDVLDSQVDSLKKELEKQAQIFEEELEALTEAKREEEQRVVQAEEDLRKTELSYEKAAERLREEFKQVYDDMSVKIEENKKLAQKATAEVDDLRQKNEVLEEQLQKAREELEINQDKCERMLREHAEQNEGVAGNCKDSKKAERKTFFRRESGQTKTTTEESELIQGWKLEREDLERRLASVRKEAEKLRQEKAAMKSQIDQKMSREENLHLEVKKLRLKNNEVKNHLHELELEKEGLKKEMSKCKTEQERERAARKKTATSPMKERSGQSGGSCEVSSLSSEVASLKERNKKMEEELKEMHERYSEISLRFAEVEGERQQLVMDLRNLKSGKKN